MPNRRFTITLALLCLLVTGVISITVAQSQTPVPADPAGEPGRTVLGKWLRIIKSPEGLPDPLYVTRGGNARFAIVVINTSESFALEDVTVSDPLTPDCNVPIGGMLPGETVNYVCTYNDVQAPFTNEATVSGVNATNNQTDNASDTARVEVLELTADLAAEPSSLAVPGGAVKFTVTITNKSSTTVRLTSLSSTELGNLADPQNSLLQNNTCAANGELPQLAANGGVLQCSFDSQVTGLPGDYAFDVGASAVAGENATVSGNGGTVIELFELISVALNAAKEKVVLNSNVQLTATVQNLDESRSVKITDMVDATLGDITPLGDCMLPRNLSPEESFSCRYTQMATGDIGETQSFILDVFGETDDSPPQQVTDRASADITVVEPLIRLPLLLHIPIPNSCRNALLIETNVEYSFYPIFRNAVYKFVLDVPRDVTVEIKHFAPGLGQGQISVYKETCSIQGRIAFDGFFSETKILRLGEQQAGSYFVQVFSGNDLSQENPYSVFIRAE